MNEKTVSVVIPVCNAERTIAKTIDACLNQNYPKEKLEVIVVNDGSTDNTAQIVKRYPVIYIFQEKGGPAKARNSGWKNAKGEIICFTDADCIPSRNWVSSLISDYISDEISGVGGSYEILNSDNLLSSCIHEEIMQRHLRMSKETNYLGSFNLSLRRSLLEKIGGFDESFKMASSEDRELSYRIIKNGKKLIFNQDIKVYHSYPTNLFKYLRQQFWRIFWEVGVYLYHYQMPTKDQYIFFTEYFQPPLFLGIIIFFLLSSVSPFFCSLLYSLFFLAVLLQLPLVYSVIRRTGEMKYIALLPINFLRGFVWALGGISGLLSTIFGRKK